MRIAARLAGGAAVAALAAVATGGAAQAETWRMQVSTVAGDLIYQVLEEWAADVAAATDGRVEIEWAPINAVVGLTEVMESVGVGILDGEFTASTCPPARTRPSRCWAT